MIVIKGPLLKATRKEWNTWQVSLTVSVGVFWKFDIGKIDRTYSNITEDIPLVGRGEALALIELNHQLPNCWNVESIWWKFPNLNYLDWVLHPQRLPDFWIPRACSVGGRDAGVFAVAKHVHFVDLQARASALHVDDELSSGTKSSKPTVVTWTMKYCLVNDRTGESCPLYIYITTNEGQIGLSKDWKWLAPTSGGGAAIYREGVKSTETPQHLKLCMDGKYKMASKACCCQTSTSLFAFHLKISCPRLHVVPHWWVPKLPSYGQKEFETVVL